MRFKRRHQLGPELVHQFDYQTNSSLILIQPERNKLRPFFAFVRKLDVTFLRFTSKLCKMNLFGDQKGLVLFDWPNLIYSMIIFSILNLVVSLYYHYDYDYYVFHLNRLHRAKLEGQSLSLVFNSDNTSRLESYLQAQVELKREKLRQLGAPLISAPRYSPAVCYLNWLGYTFFVCLNLILNGRQGKLRTNYIRLLSNPSAEQRRLNKFALIECNKFLDSNFNYNELYWTENASKCAIDHHAALLLSPTGTGNEARKLLLDYEENVDHLRSIITKGDIIRLHSFTTNRLNMTSLFHGYNFVAINLFYVIVGALTINSLRKEPEVEVNLAQKVNELLAFLYIVVTIITFVFTGVSITLLLVIDWWDQIELIRRLNKLLVDCVNENNRLYYGQCRDQEHYRHLEMNANLLFVLINYRIFPMRMKGPLSSQGHGANVSLRVMFVLPVVVRLHAPYCSPDFLLTFVYVSACVSLVTVTLMATSCHLNDKTIELHKPLASLMAHVVQVNEDYNTKRSTNVYSKHTVWCIRQELKDLNRFQEFCLPRSSTINLRFTFPALIKVQFWFNLLILSIFAQSIIDHPAAMSSSDRLLSDPLGLLNDRF